LQRIRSVTKNYFFKLHSNYFVTERQLIDRCLHDDRNAQRILYERYKNAMFTLAFRITGNFEVAAEVLQDAFLQIFRHLSSFQGRSTLGAWIKAIVVRTAIGSTRRQHILHFEAVNDQTEQIILDWGDHLDAEYLEKAILELPEGYRSVFVLAEIEGFSHAEIAEMLQISEGTSKSQLFHAKKRLRARLTVLNNF
jgi:RNA polymerase sigma-70 factor (ECF subfamily)